jgi:hypothetical protein
VHLAIPFKFYVFLSCVSSWLMAVHSLMKDLIISQRGPHISDHIRSGKIPNSGNFCVIWAYAFLLKIRPRYDTLEAANVHLAIPNLKVVSQMCSNTDLIQQACSSIVALKIKISSK